MFSIKSILGVTPEVEIAQSLYGATIRAARDPKLFTDWALPDTPEGRFEALALFAFLLLHRTKDIEKAEKVSQAYFDVMFDDIDANLRELGVGELSVGKRVKKLAAGFYGRIKAYEDGLNADDRIVLKDALTRNLYGSDKPEDEILEDLSAFIEANVAHLDAQLSENIINGTVTFLSPSDTRTVNDAR